MEYVAMLMPTIWAVIYTLGAYLYYWHVKTIIYFAGDKEAGYSEFKMLCGSAIWPLEVIKIILLQVTYKEGDDG